MVKYFVKHGKIHKYPLPSTCYVKYEEEKLYDDPPSTFEKCDICFPKSGLK
jgi:hypothetical protein